MNIHGPAIARPQAAASLSIFGESSAAAAFTSGMARWRDAVSPLNASVSIIYISSNPVSTGVIDPHFFGANEICRRFFLSVASFCGQADEFFFGQALAFEGGFPAQHPC
ncbi:MAG: hypothetical protein ABGX47_26350 [Martelella sp.]|uniref:hypothetical protein n=1 Tax=Martelella sp. TaxID=1969699 RepID=UPI003241EF84